MMNYKTDPNWGETAVKLTVDGIGVNQVLKVGGPTTMIQSLKAFKIDGVISIIGFVAGKHQSNQPTFLECMSHVCMVRGDSYR